MNDPLMIASESSTAHGPDGTQQAHRPWIKTQNSASNKKIFERKTVVRLILNNERTRTKI
jgi:hypothetical protein